MPDLIYTLCLFFLGLLFGSFLNVVVMRLPQKKSIGGRSHCGKCGHLLTAIDLVPIFSFIFLFGKCRYCKSRISWRYPFTELVTAIIFTSLSLKFSPASAFGSVELLWALIVCCFGIVIFYIDWEHFLILDKVVFPGLIVICILNLIRDILYKTSFFSITDGFFISGITASLVAGALFYLIWFLTKGRGMGFGDVKLMLFLGAVAGFPGVLVIIFLAFLSGGVIGGFLLILNLKKLKEPIPFGTFLTVAMYINLLFGKPLLNWYLRLLGY